MQGWGMLASRTNRGTINREKSASFAWLARQSVAHRGRKAARAWRRIAPRHFRYKTGDYANTRPGSMESKNVSDFLYEIARPFAGCDLRKRHAPGTRDRQRRQLAAATTEIVSEFHGVFDESADLAAEMVTRLFSIVWLSFGIWNLSANGCGYGFRRLAYGARKIRFIVQSISH